MRERVVQVKRQWPTWQVVVDDEVLFTGLWRRRTAEYLAHTLTH